MKLNILISVITFNIVGLTSTIVYAQTNQFTNLSGTVEKCRILLHLPIAKYSSKDLKTEKELCDVNFYDDQVFLCGKNWSTSPSTLIFKKNTQFISVDKSCENRRSMELFDKVGKFKVSMNESGTSGTFSSSSLLYYHLSRYFKTSVIVPVAVSREMNVQSHFQMVTSKVKLFENKMIQTAWDYLYKAENGNPAAVQPTTDLFTQDYSNIFGALIDPVGNEKYAEHIRGSKNAQWGLAQHLEMKKTPAFRALLNSNEFFKAQEEAARFGLENFKADFNQNLPEPFQMISWMQDMSDMAVLDFIIQQQDRPGNIHFQWRIYYNVSGQLKSDRIKVVNNGIESGLEKKFKLPKDIDRVRALAFALLKYKSICNQPGACFVIQKTVLEDNDAGARIYYHNFFKKAQILQSLRHLNLGTYTQLMLLDSSIQKKDPVYYQLKSEFNLDQKQFVQLTNNISEAAQILKQSYDSGLLRLDLDFETFLKSGNLN